jgi:hypothetical protein
MKRLFYTYHLKNSDLVSNRHRRLVGPLQSVQCEKQKKLPRRNRKILFFEHYLFLPHLVTYY